MGRLWSTNLNSRYTYLLEQTPYYNPQILMTPLLRGDLALRNLHISGSGWATVIKFRQQLQLLVWKWWATLLQVLVTLLLLDHVTLKKLLSSLWRSCSFEIWTSDAACGESEWTLLLRSWRCLCCMVKRYWHRFISRVKIRFIKFGQLMWNSISFACEVIITCSCDSDKFHQYM